MKRSAWILFVALLLAGLTFNVTADSGSSEPAPLLLVLDASGSMWGQIDGENKIVIARRVLGGLVDGLSDGSDVGLIAYGHRREGDCDDIETVVPLATLDKAALKETVNAFNPKGKTPITASLKQAFGILDEKSVGATVILISDGLETCGGDPCATVRAAKESGTELILHVVGFDVAGEDVSQLECAAQAGGGLFMSAENADELSAALENAVALPVDLPAGRLSVKAVNNGELQDVAIHVSDAETGEDAGGARTYESEATNPSSIPLPDGKFEVLVRAVGIKGDTERRFEIEVNEGSTIEKTIDYSTGEIAVGATKNGGTLSDATFQVVVAGTRTQSAAGRTYTSEKSNPKVVTVTSGVYDVSISSVEIKGKPSHQIKDVTVEPGKRVELTHEFQSGILKVGAVKDGELVDVTVGIVDLEGHAVAQGRTYVDAKTNPKTFQVPPGRYTVNLKAVRLEGSPSRKVEVVVNVGETTEEMVDFGG